MKPSHCRWLWWEQPRKPGRKSHCGVSCWVSLHSLQARQLCVLQLCAPRLLFFFPFLFSQTRNQYFGSNGRGGEGGRAVGDRSWPLPKQLCYVHGTLKTHSAQSGCRGNPAEPMIRGKWSHFLTSCFIQVEKVLTSSGVLRWPQLTEPQATCFPF